MEKLFKLKVECFQITSFFRLLLVHSAVFESTSKVIEVPVRFRAIYFQLYRFIFTFLHEIDQIHL